MKLQERVYNKCKSCGANKSIQQEESYGCDYCKKSIDELFQSEGKRHADVLELTVFFTEGDTKHLQFCSWKCVLKKLKTLKTGYFVTLPYLHYEKDVLKGQGVKDFLALLK